MSRLLEYETIEIYDDHCAARSKNHANDTPKHCWNFGNDSQGPWQSYEGSDVCKEKCENSLMHNDENLILSHFYWRHLRREIFHKSHETSDD